jgi:hypothetical protein
MFKAIDMCSNHHTISIYKSNVLEINWKLKLMKICLNETCIVKHLFHGFAVYNNFKQDALLPSLSALF